MSPVPPGGPPSDDDEPPGGGAVAQGSFFDQGASLNAGHRERLRDRFRKGGADALPDYELLELLLFRALPRRDTKGLAKRLIARFGSFAEVINAPETRLKEVNGVGESVITELKLVRAAAVRLMRREVDGKPAFASTPAVVDYLRAVQAFESREQFRILFLDRRNHLIADEVQGQGTVDHTPVYVREVVKRALELSATAIILVHNHPSGDPALPRRYRHDQAHRRRCPPPRGNGVGPHHRRSPGARQLQAAPVAVKLTWSTKWTTLPNSPPYGPHRFAMEISIRDAKAKLTSLIRRAESGEEVVVTRHGKPVATIASVKSVPSSAQRREVLNKFLGRAVDRVPPGTTSRGAQDDLYDDTGLPK